MAAGEAALEATALVVMNGFGRLLLPDVGIGDRVDDEAEDLELHDISRVYRFPSQNEKFQVCTGMNWYVPIVYLI